MPQPNMGNLAADDPPRQPYQRDNRPNLTTVIDTMRKWNLRFSGSEDADAYLHRLREARGVLRLTDADLLAGIPCLLTGIAAEWYRYKSVECHTFAQFERAFQNRFLDFDYQYQLSIDIENRRQGEKEPAATYLTKIRSMIARAVPQWPEQAIIDRAYRNLLPSLQLNIDRETIGTFERLEYLAMKRERAVATSKDFQPPPSLDRTLIPGLGYQPPKSSKPRPAKINLTEEQPTSEDSADSEDEVMVIKVPRRKSRPTKARMTPRTENRGAEKSSAERQSREPAGPKLSQPCLNCDSPDHWKRDCPEPLRIRCYGCKREGITKDKCPDCNSGNEKGGL